MTTTCCVHFIKATLVYAKDRNLLPWSVCLGQASSENNKQHRLNNIGHALLHFVVSCAHRLADIRRRLPTLVMVFSHHLVFIKLLLRTSPLSFTQRQTNVGHGLPTWVVSYTVLNQLFLWTTYIDCAWVNAKLSFAYRKQHHQPLVQIRQVMLVNERLHELRPIRVRRGV